MSARAAVLLISAWGAFALACKAKEATVASTPAPVSPAAAEADVPRTAPASGGAHETARPNYALADGKAAHPRAIALCEALHTLPVTKKAECLGAKEAGLIITPMCVEALSAALELGKIRLDDAAIDRCKTAMTTAVSDCSFAKGINTPLPAECDGVIQGSLGEGQACRSALECNAGLQCFGVGPTDLGRCLPPAPPGTVCGSGVDALATYTRQMSAERTRPACDGYCRLNRCLAFHAAGAECASDVQCGPSARCASQKCTAL